MKKVNRTKPELDFVRLVARNPRHRKLEQYTAEAVQDFGSALAGDASAVLSHEGRVAGIRAESVFAAVLTGIGNVLLVKEEDHGDVFYKDDEVTVPDFRVVLKDGRQLLVEVKRSEVSGNAAQRVALSDRRVAGLRRYAALTGAALYFAILWEDISLWTLNGVDAFQEGEAGQRAWSISLARAFTTNEMILVGDCQISTPPPLRFRIVVDGDHSDPMPNGDGHMQIQIQAIQLLSEDRVLEGLGLKIASTLMWFGTWEEWDQEVEHRDGKLVHIDYPIGPPEIDEAARSVPIIGGLSQIITRCYLQGARKTVHTTSESEVLQPGFMGEQFIPDNWMDLNLGIPIAKLYVRPNFDPAIISGLE